MTVTVEVTFPLGRYHATPWDRHVNEGIVEWPPSPWRLARALYAVWKERLPSLPHEDVMSALSIVARPPTYGLPSWRAAATRHYYPDGAHRAGKTSTDKVIDAFIAVDPDAPLMIEWPDGELSPGAASALSAMLDHLTYLGRADSACIAKVTASADGYSTTTIRPDEGGEHEVAVPSLPLDEEQLTITTDQMRKARLRKPPSMVRVPYTAPAGPQRSAGSPKRPESAKPTVAVFAIAGTPAPAHRLAVAVGDLFSMEVNRVHTRIAGVPSSVLSGHPPDSSEKRTDPHLHLHVLPLCEGGPGSLPSSAGRKIDRIIAWAPEGFGPTECAALGMVTDLRLIRRALANPDGRPVIRGLTPMSVLLTGLGVTDLLTQELRGPSTSWVSATPFVPTHHQKRRHRPDRSVAPFGCEFLREEIERELRYRGSQFGARVLEVEAAEGGSATSYRRYRVRERLDDARKGVLVRMTLDREVEGPIALGALSHFGLGLFIPAPGG